MIKALVFDMDGLIFDSERIVQRSWEDAGNILGIPHMGGHIYNTLGMNAAARKIYFSEAVGADFPYEEFRSLTSLRFREIVEKEGLLVKPGAEELMACAKDRGLKLAVATSSSRKYASRNLKEADLYRYFDSFVYGDMVHHAKPNPEIYLMACGALGVNPAQAVALEDSPGGIRSAHSAGMIPVMVPDLVQPDEEVRELAYKVVRTLHEIPALIEELS